MDGNNSIVAQALGQRTVDHVDRPGVKSRVGQKLPALHIGIHPLQFGKFMFHKVGTKKDLPLWELVRVELAGSTEEVVAVISADCYRVHGSKWKIIIGLGFLPLALV